MFLRVNISQDPHIQRVLHSVGRSPYDTKVYVFLDEGGKHVMCTKVGNSTCYRNAPPNIVTYALAYMHTGVQIGYLGTDHVPWDIPQRKTKPFPIGFILLIIVILFCFFIGVLLGCQ